MLFKAASSICLHLSDSGLLCRGYCQYLYNPMFKHSQKFAKKVSQLPSNPQKMWNFFTTNKKQ